VQTAAVVYVFAAAVRRAVAAENAAVSATTEPHQTVSDVNSAVSAMTVHQTVPVVHSVASVTTVRRAGSVVNSAVSATTVHQIVPVEHSVVAARLAHVAAELVQRTVAATVPAAASSVGDETALSAAAADRETVASVD